MRAEEFRNLLDARDNVEVTESAIEAVEVGLGIRGKKYWSKLIDRSRIRRGEAHPQFSFAGGEFHAVNVDRQFAQIRDIDGTVVLTPSRDNLPFLNPWNLNGTPSVHRKDKYPFQVSLRGHPFSVG